MANVETINGKDVMDGVRAILPILSTKPPLLGFHTLITMAFLMKHPEMPAGDITKGVVGVGNWMDDYIEELAEVKEAKDGTNSD